MYFYESRPLKLLIAGLYLTVVLAAGLFHTHHHDCNHCQNSPLACDHVCGSGETALETETNASPCCSCHCQHAHDAQKSMENHGEEPTPRSTPSVRGTGNLHFSEAHRCPICSFLAQKQLNAECPRLPIWTPLCGEREETFAQPYIIYVSFSWLSRAPPLNA